MCTDVMGEKYDTEHVGSFGGGLRSSLLPCSPQAMQGGEYVAQTGFGWSNGVVLALLARLPDLNCETD
jgi:alpha,alpha-trehalase